MIEVSGLSKFYAGRPAIEDISFSIDEGEIVGLLGLNGAGKSTILKILGCFLMPSRGTARVAGHSVEDNPHAIRKSIGYLPDSPPLYDEMPVKRYLRYVGKLKNVESSRLDTMVQDAMDKTSLGAVEDVPLGNLSHGFRQRVGIAQAIVHKPKVLILDEPINGLDPVQIVEMRDLILSLRKQHTVILSSHILSEITKTCDRILIVNEGKLVATGNEEELSHGQASVLGIVCEVEQVPEGLIAQLEQLPNVSRVQLVQSEIPSIEVSMDNDCRKDVAKAIVSSGAGLLSLQQHGGTLEGLFMKFVRS